MNKNVDLTESEQSVPTDFMARAENLFPRITDDQAEELLGIVNDARRAKDLSADTKQRVVNAVNHALEMFRVRLACDESGTPFRLLFRIGGRGQGYIYLHNRAGPSRIPLEDAPPLSLVDISKIMDGQSQRHLTGAWQAAQMCRETDHLNDQSPHSRETGRIPHPLHASHRTTARRAPSAEGIGTSPHPG